MYKYQIPPFKAAIEAGTTSMMPYYSYPSNQHSAKQLVKEMKLYVEVFQQDGSEEETTTNASAVLSYIRSKI